MLALMMVRCMLSRFLHEIILINYGGGHSYTIFLLEASTPLCTSFFFVRSQVDVSRENRIELAIMRSEIDGAIGDSRR